MARVALILHREAPATAERRLARILEFFGVPCRSVAAADIPGAPGGTHAGEDYAVLGSMDALDAALDLGGAAAWLRGAAAVYAFAADDRQASTTRFSRFVGAGCAVLPAPRTTASATVSSCCPEVAGPMSAITLSLRPAATDGIFSLREPPSDHGDVNAGGAELTSIVSVDGTPAFVRIRRAGLLAYASASSSIVDIDQPVGRNCYDVKEHFLSAVPLVMFIASVFREAMWRSPEIGGCLIVDDPLLKSRYGFCDFSRLRALMGEHHFTTNVAFIPWNWRRTAPQASGFFRREADVFSVSVHGCDHISAEFGPAPGDVLDARARLAQARMRRHQARTGIDHEPVMVFPQGVFSSGTPAVLKRNGFVAAVNTEISPVDDADGGALVRDVWDTAIVRYGAFAIFTRRYAHHGLENFAFDMLLGKPCFIVAHHEFFRDGGAALAALVEQLRSLNRAIVWRSPRQVIRRAYRSRIDGGRLRVRIYGTEALLENPGERACEYHVEKAETDTSLIARVAIEGREATWSGTPDGVSLDCTIAPRSSALVTIDYRNESASSRIRASMGYSLSVAARRVLSELRDEYVQKLWPGRVTIPAAPRRPYAVTSTAHR
jgi:hypothetical protein